MNCQMLAVVDNDRPEAAKPLQTIPERFAEWEQHFSRFRPDSELSQLNRHAGEQQPVSTMLWEVLQAALQAAVDSDGLVNPTLLNALESAGYDRSFETLSSLEPLNSGLSSGVLPAAQLTEWGAIEAEARTQTVRLPKGVRLDLGGVAKGWAADQAAAELGAAGPALVDAGGDIAISAPPQGQPGWPIGLANPLAPGESPEVLCVAHGGVATSGRDYRRWQQHGQWRHHILDPRTGCPAETDVLSATVIAPSASEAETAAKVALILGSRAGLAWLEARPTLAGVLVLEDGTTQHTRHFLDYIWR
jgi:thiamine biosynthesis lipoprotein